MGTRRSQESGLDVSVAWLSPLKEEEEHFIYQDLIPPFSYLIPECRYYVPDEKPEVFTHTLLVFLAGVDLL